MTMNYADFLKGIGFRFAGPRAARDEDGRYVVTRRDGSRARWLALPGVPPDLFNAVLPQDESQIRSRLRQLCSIPKMSTFGIGAIVHQAVARMPADHAFVNVGVWNGFTLLCGLAGNPDSRGVGIDNFSQFGGPRDDFLARFESRRSPRHEFHDLDYTEYFARIHHGPIGVYIYDGEHSYQNQLKGLQTAEPFFSEDCIIVVDDTNWIEPWQATLDFISQSRHDYRLLLDQTTCQNGHPSFWNGVMVLQRTGRHGQPDAPLLSLSEFRRAAATEPRPPTIDWNAALALEPRVPAAPVSVVIAHCQAEADLAAAIAGARNLTYPNVEIVVVDLVCSELSQEIMAGCGRRVLAIHGASGADLSAAFRAGLDASHGDWVCFLDSEQVLVPTAIEKGLTFGREPSGRMHSVSDWYDNIFRSVSELARIVPPRQTLVLVDDQQWEISGMVADRRVLPFLEHGGEYHGPAPDDGTAIRELERMRKEHGAGFIVFGWPAFWWLDHYKEFSSYLQTHFRCLLQNERVRVFDLRMTTR
jgi:Glycosyl transferase family 2/Methyltransferase domain